MIEQGFFIPGPLPGLNEMLDAKAWIRRGRGTKRPNRYNDLKRKWEGLICMEIAHRRIKPVIKPVELEFYWTERDRRRDPDNIAAGKKLILDSLVMAGIIPNDSQAWIKGWTDNFTEPSKKDPGVLVMIQQNG